MRLVWEAVVDEEIADQLSPRVSSTVHAAGARDFAAQVRCGRIEGNTVSSSPVYSMGRVVEWAQDFALALGAPGLFVVAILDSSFLTLPEINDILVVLMVTRHRSFLPLYAGAATAGSIVGSLVLYSIGRKGGEAVLQKRFSVERSNRAMAFIQQYGVLAIIIPSLLPPPMPFKMFVLLSGIARIPAPRF